MPDPSSEPNPACARHQIGPLRIDCVATTVELAGHPVRLTKKEYALVECLASHAGTIVSKSQILDHLYPSTTEPCQKIIDVFVCKIRGKFAATLTSADKLIQTVWGRGYVLRQ
jgi:two-component system cell cycle response regulator CtrA